MRIYLYALVSAVVLVPEERSIHIQLSTRFKAKLALLLIIIVAVQVLVFYLGILYGTKNTTELRDRQRDLVHELNEKSIALKDKTAELIKVSKSAEIDRLAAEQVRQDTFKLRAQAINLQKDVEFYKGLMAPDELDKGFKLHTFKLAQDAATGYYRFRLVLANIGSKGQVVKGSMGLKLQGTVDGERKEIEITELPDYDGAQPIKLRFRFFQNVEGAFKLPDAWQPAALVAYANIKDSSGQLFSVSYSWQDLLENDYSGGGDVW